MQGWARCNERRTIGMAPGSVNRRRRLARRRRARLVGRRGGPTACDPFEPRSARPPDLARSTARRRRPSLGARRARDGTRAPSPHTVAGSAPERMLPFGHGARGLRPGTHPILRITPPTPRPPFPVSDFRDRPPTGPRPGRIPRATVFRDAATPRHSRLGASHVRRREKATCGFVDSPRKWPLDSRPLWSCARRDCFEPSRRLIVWGNA